MAENEIQFELVSPEKLLLSEPVEMVVVPGAEGDFGAMAGHSPLISTVRTGVIHIFEKGAVKSRIFVAGGFAEVTPDRCTVLAEQAVPIDDLDRGRIEDDLKNAQDEARETSDPLERAGAESRAAIARAKLEALEQPTYQ